MFKKWLKFDVSPTWDKVDAAIKAVTSDTKGLSFNHKGELYACIWSIELYAWNLTRSLAREFLMMGHDFELIYIYIYIQV